MPNVLRHIARTSAALVLATALMPNAFADPLPSASATITFTNDATPGLYDYSITLSNTGPTSIAEFWFAWIPGKGFLTSTPTTLFGPAGWTESIAGGGIQWITTTSPLASSGSLSGFNFISAETPNQFAVNYTGVGLGSGDPNTTSFVYIVKKSATDTGTQFTPSIAATPEPASISLLLTGFGALALTRFRSRLKRN